MHRDDVLSQVRRRARLHGPNHARRVVQAVLRALGTFVPDSPLRALAEQVPAELGATPPGTGRPADTGARRRLIRDIAEQLNVSEPDAAFFARVTFEQLNAYCHGTTPEQLAPQVPADLRPLLTARTEEPAHRHRELVRTMSGGVTALNLRPPARQVIAKKVFVPPADTTAPTPAPTTSRKAARHHVG